jgi:hypothetical protein
VAEPLRLRFDPGRYPLAEAAAAALGVPSLADIAEAELARKRAVDPEGELTAEDNVRLRDVLGGLPHSHVLKRLYVKLTTEVVSPAFGGRVACNVNPKFRVHLPGTGSVSAWHRDADITRRPDYVTGWIPFVDTFGTNTVWVETDYGRGDHRPIPVRYGEILCFDAAFLSHGSVRNTTGVTRVSMDFRFAPNPRDGSSPDRGIFADRPPDIATKEQQ